MPLSAADICKLARQISKAPVGGYLLQSGQMFSLVMSDLLLKRDLRVNLTIETIAVPANSNGPFTGAANYLRTYDLFFNIGGQIFFLDPVELAQFDAEFQDPQVSNYPYEYAVDSSPQAHQLPQLIYIYPMSNVPLSMQHRYFMQQPDIVSPETSAAVPWYQDQQYLIHATATELMKITDDTRYGEFVKAGEEMLRKYLIQEGDKRGLTARIKLDPQQFRRARALRNTKVTI